MTKTDNISYFSRVEAGSRTALVEWNRRGAENTHTVDIVRDGALRIQSFIDYHCPRAVRVVDFAHA